MALKRISEIDDGIFGALLDFNNEPFALTLENNETEIPPGIYDCERSMYYKHDYETFEIIVPDRSRILFHIGNIEDDSTGCILIGEQFEHLRNKTAIWRSRKGFNEFMNKLENVDNFKLEIEKCY